MHDYRLLMTCDRAGRGRGQFSSGIARGLTCSQVVEKGIIHKVSCNITSCIRLSFRRKGVLCIFTIISSCIRLSLRIKAALCFVVDHGMCTGISPA